jgi:hypothetical protein
MTAPGGGVIRRSLRRFTLGSGPLKRRSDRVQVLGRWAVVVAFLVSPPLAVATTAATATHLHEVADQEAAERTRTSAVLIETAALPTPDPIGNGDSSGWRVPARAIWTTPGGTSREGTVPAPPRTPAGSSVRVWVDREGDLTGPPLDRSGVDGTAAAMGALPLIGVPVAAWALYAGLACWLDAHRERRWAEGWAAVEPDWHSRLL